MGMSYRIFVDYGDEGCWLEEESFETVEAALEIGVTSTRSINIDKFYIVNIIKIVDLPKNRKLKEKAMRKLFTKMNKKK